jgi:hypothetical protein
VSTTARKKRNRILITSFANHNPKITKAAIKMRRTPFLYLLSAVLLFIDH